MAKKELSTYKKTRAETAGPGQRVVMVYDGIIKNIKIADKLLESPRPETMETINNSLQLAERLVLELKLALDKKIGGEFAEKLEGLYDFWIDVLSEANIKKNNGKLKEILVMVQELRDSWEQAAKETRKSGM